MEGNGIQPVMPITGGYGDGLGCGGGMWFMWLVVIFALMGGGGFGFGNRAGLTQAEMQAGLEKTVMQGNYALGSQLAENRFAQQQCCCETNRNIDAVRAENYKNSCEIKTAIHEEAERTRGLMMANQMQELRDKLADRDRALQSANFNLSQMAQNATIVGQLKPYPTPAYIVSSPYQSTTGGTTTT